MLPIESDIQGKKVVYGDIAEPFRAEGFELGGNWGYNGGYFDKVLARSDDQSETVYLRLPVKVIQGALDQPGAHLVFGRPLVIKHVVHTGLEYSSNEHFLSDQAGLSPIWNQFQSPVDADGDLSGEERWKRTAQAYIDRIVPYVNAEDGAQ